MNWRDVPSLPALRGFEAAARAGSFSQAARELNVTHAAIAQHVRAVEAHLGVSLLNRQGRRMVLTNAGAQLAADLTDGFQTIVSGVAKTSATAQNSPLNLTLTPNFAENWLMPRLCDFWAEYPDLTVSITPSNDVIDMRRDGFDMAIRFGTGDWAGHDATFLLGGDYVVVAAKSLLEGRNPTCIADLQDVQWLFSPTLPVYRTWAEQNGLDTTCCPIREVATMSMIAAAVRAGAGASVMIRAMAADDITAGRLVAVQEETKPGLGYYIVTPKGVPPPKVATFKKWLLDQAR